MKMGIVSALRPQLTAGDVELLEAWARLPGDRLARRAGFVLSAAAGESIESLSRTSGVPRQRIAALLAEFASSGVMALVDAPRRGRSRTTAEASPGASPLRAGAFPAGSAAVQDQTRWRTWRDRREAALNDDRRRRRLDWPPAVANGPLSQVRALAIGPVASVILLRTGAWVAGSAGCWLFPRLDLLVDGASALHDSPDWRFLVERVRAIPGAPDRTRAVTERRQAWLGEAMLSRTSTASPTARTVLIGGDPSAKEFQDWLTALRACANTESGAQVALRVMGCGSPETWSEAIARGLGLSDGAIRRRLSDPVAEMTWRAPSHVWWVASPQSKRRPSRTPGYE